MTNVSKCVLTALAILVWANPVFAHNPVSSAEFKPYSANDVNYIQHSTWYVYNSDASNSRYAIADLGVASYGANSTIIPAVIFSAPAAGSFTCWVAAVRVDSAGTVYVNSNTYTMGGASTFSVGSFSVTVGAAGTYATTITCLLPPTSGGQSWLIMGVR